MRDCICGHSLLSHRHGACGASGCDCLDFQEAPDPNAPIEEPSVGLSDEEIAEIVDADESDAPNHTLVYRDERYACVCGFVGDEDALAAHFAAARVTPRGELQS